MVPFNNLSRRAERHADELAAIAARVLSSGRYLMGKEVEAFESAFALYIGVSSAIGVNSGTDAIALALRAVGVKAGDEVATVGNAGVPPIAAIRMIGAVPRFVDVDAATYNMDPEDLEHRLTPAVKAILPVHLYGFPADMERIGAIAQAHGIPVVEDVAQAHGATISGRKVGSFGKANAFSFYPTKNLGAFGDAGAVVANDTEMAEQVRRLRMYGEKSRYESVEEGINSRLDEIQAALLSWSLPQLDAANGRRSEIAKRYQSGIQNPSITLPNQDTEDRKGVWHLFVVRTEKREAFRAHLAERGIDTAIHYAVPVYRQEAYAFLSVNPADFPRTEAACTEVVSLPFFPDLTDVEIEEVIAAVNAYTG